MSPTYHILKHAWAQGLNCLLTLFLHSSAHTHSTHALLALSLPFSYTHLIALAYSESKQHLHNLFGSNSTLLQVVLELHIGEACAEFFLAERLQEK